MAQVSGTKIEDRRWNQMWKKMVELVGKNMSGDESEVVLEGILTSTEKEMVVKRLMVWVLVKSGWSVPKMSRVLSMSTSSVYRLQAMFEQNEKFNQVMGRLVRDRVKKPKRNTSLEDLEELVDDFLLAELRKKYPGVFGK